MSTPNTTDSVPTTKREAYRRIKARSEDVALRRRVAAALAAEPDTTAGLASRFPEHSSNAIRPRVNELLRMGCVKRDGTQRNASGHEAYVHHITPTGEAYLRGDRTPDPGPTVAERAKAVVEMAREVVTGEVTEEELRETVRAHDRTKVAFDPDFETPLLTGDAGMDA